MSYDCWQKRAKDGVDVEAAYARFVLSRLHHCMRNLQMLDLDLEYVVHGRQGTLDADWAEAARQRLGPAKRLLKELQEELLAGQARRRGGEEPEEA